MGFQACLFNSASSREKVYRNSDLQFEQRQVGVTVICPILALLCDIILEYCRRFGVVSVEAVEDDLDVLRAAGAVVEG